jgi:Tol biopolymer transport system component
MPFSSSDSILIYRPGDQGGLSPTRLEWRKRDGTVAESVSDVALYAAIALSPDGRHIVVGRSRPSELRLFDHGSPSSQLVPARINGTPVWSPAGDALAFGRDSSVVRKDMATGNETTLFRDQRNVSPSGWSPDGRLLYGVMDPATGWDIWETTGDNRPPHPYLATQFSEGHAQFSPDGRWVVYVSDESGVKEVYVDTDPVSARKLKISDGGGFMPQWRADGRALYYLDAQSRLVEVPVTLGPNFKVGKSHPLFTGEINQGLSDHFVTQYGVSPDGQRFLFKTPAGPDPPMMVMFNWRPSSGAR